MKLIGLNLLTAFVFLNWIGNEKNAADEANQVQALGRMGKPSEIAKVVTFLLSDKATYVSGSDWAVDGGLGARSA